MRSVQQSTGVVPRCSTSQLLSLTLIIFLTNVTINICESANVEIARPLTSNHPRYPRALLAEFPLFLQHSQTSQVVAVEVDQTATIKQLYELAAEQFGVDIDSVQLRLGGVLIENTHTPLADWSDDESALSQSGISAEAQIEVVINKRNDISQLLDMIDDAAKSRFFSEAELQRIRELNQQAMQSADGDISEVAEFITSHFDRKDYMQSLLSERSAIYEIRTYVDEQSETARHRINKLEFALLVDNLRWQHLPKHTETVEVIGGSVTAIDFSGIECENLRGLYISSMHKLVRVELSGLEKCSMLETLAIDNNNELKRLSVAPLAHCRNLKRLDLHHNALEDLDLSPLSRSSSLQQVWIDGNQFTRDVAEPLHALTERGLQLI